MSLVTPSHIASMSTLELLADPERLANHIGQLKTAEESARSQIALAGPASEILQLREKTGQLHDEAVETLSAAHGEAQTIVEQAQSEAEQIIDDAARVAKDIDSKIQRRATLSEEVHQEAQRKLAKANTELGFLDQRARNLSNEREELDEREADLDNLNTQLLQEKSKLATVREQIENILG